MVTMGIIAGTMKYVRVVSSYLCMVASKSSSREGSPVTREYILGLMRVRAQLVHLETRKAS